MLNIEKRELMIKRARSMVLPVWRGVTVLSIVCDYACLNPYLIYRVLLYLEDVWLYNSIVMLSLLWKVKRVTLRVPRFMYSTCECQKKRRLICRYSKNPYKDISNPQPEPGVCDIM